MNFRAWRAHFERNAARPLPLTTGPLPHQGSEGSESASLVARSLARFQLGEAGEGRIAHEIWTKRVPGIDDDYRVALGLFVKEEARHARILAGLVLALDGKLLERTWTETLFVASRRLLGIRLKLLVLLVAEVVGIAFYGLLAERVPYLRGPLSEMCRDEDAHLAFHADFFRTQATTAPRRLLFHVAFRLVALAAGTAVLLDHRSTLRALGVPLREAASRLLAAARRVVEREPSGFAVVRPA